MSFLDLLATAALCVETAAERPPSTRSPTPTPSLDDRRFSTLTANSASPPVQSPLFDSPYISSHESTTPTFARSSETRRKRRISSRSSSASSDISYRSSMLESDITVPHGRGNLSKIFTCVECKKTFHRRHHLVSHMVSHSEGKPFGCTIPGCSATFRRQQDMRRHMRKVKHILPSTIAVEVSPAPIVVETMDIPRAADHVNVPNASAAAIAGTEGMLREVGQAGDGPMKVE